MGGWKVEEGSEPLEKTNELKVTIQKNKNKNGAMENKECASVCPCVQAPPAHYQHNTLSLR